MKNKQYFKINTMHPLYQRFLDETKEYQFDHPDIPTMYHLLPDKIIGYEVTEANKNEVFHNHITSLDRDIGIILRPATGELLLCYLNEPIEKSKPILIKECQFTPPEQIAVRINTRAYLNFQRDINVRPGDELDDIIHPITIAAQFPDTILGEKLTKMKKEQFLFDGELKLSSGYLLSLLYEKGIIHVINEPLPGNQAAINNDVRPLYRSECHYDYEDLLLKTPLQQATLKAASSQKNNGISF